MATTTSIQLMGETPIHFHIGRGGRFFNAGHITCKGEQSFPGLCSQFDFLYIGEDGSVTDDNGRVLDCNANDTYGELNFDGDYDRHVVMSLSDVCQCADYGESEWLDALVASGPSEEVMSYLEEMEVL